MKVLLSTLAAAALLAGAGAANAGVVISDNFDSDTAVLNWAGDSVFLSIPQPGNVPGQPSVDLVGDADGFGNLAFSGNSVDLDGSTGTGFSPAGEIQSIASLATGTYTVDFVAAGNLRGAPEQSLIVSIGGQSQTLNIPAGQGYQAYHLTFSGASGQVSFTDSGPASQQGNLIDNVVVSSVPEPATWAAMLIGFGGIGAALRRRRRGMAAVA
jgi:hypothetical protein